MSEKALSGVKVIDLTHQLSGPMCTKYLADFGADVIKIEKPNGGDPARMLYPFFKDERHLDKSGLFNYLNTNKKSISLDLKTEIGKDIIKRLVKEADVLVESFSPGVMESLGLSYEILGAINPKLVMTSISNFGQDGPYRDFKMTELTLNALGASMYNCGVDDREPLKRGGTCLQFQGGIIAAISTIGALIGAQNEGKGEYIDVSLLETQAGTIDVKTLYTLGYIYTGLINYRPQNPNDVGMNIVPAGVWPCKEGYIQIWCPNVGVEWPRFASMIGQPELMEDPRFANPLDVTYKDELAAIFVNWLSERTHLEVFEEAVKYKVPIGPILTPREVIEDKHYNERGFFVDIDHPVIGSLKYPGAPIRLTETPWEIRMPAPSLGQYNEDIFKELGYSNDEISELKKTGVI